MKIEWLGHAAFKITSDLGVSILMDPYEPGGYSGAIQYGPIQEKFDIVTISHGHADHCFTKGLLGSPLILRGAVENTLKDVHIKSFLAFHDPLKGKARGENWIFVLDVSGSRLIHLGDLGHDLDQGIIEQLQPIDVLLLPVGGTFTIDADVAVSLMNRLKPKLTIPMHFKTNKLGFDIDGIESFLKRAPQTKISKSSKIETKQEQGVVVLAHSH